MDGRATALAEKLERLLAEAAEVSVTLDRAAGTIQGVPHYSVIERRAHELGQQPLRLPAILIGGRCPPTPFKLA